MKKSNRKNKQMATKSRTFQFSESFSHLHQSQDPELKFFCETFSLIDSMRCDDTLRRFIHIVKEQNGAVECSQIVHILGNGNKKACVSTSPSENESFNFMLNCIYRTVYQIIRQGYVTCMHTSSLGVLAWEAGQPYLKSDKEEANNNKPPAITNFSREKGQAWVELAVKLQDLSEYQRVHMKIHHDFQKSNYAPDPRSKTVYGLTFFSIILGLLFMILRNCKIAEAREFAMALTR